MRVRSHLVAVQLQWCLRGSSTKSNGGAEYGLTTSSTGIAKAGKINAADERALGFVRTE